MRAVVQRVREASVMVEDELVGSCGAGLLVLLGIAASDGEADADRLAAKIARLRIFENVEGRFDLSLWDVAGEALVVSQFTLIADTRKGSRPSFTDAAEPSSPSLCTSVSASRSSSRASLSRAVASARRWR